MSNTLLLQKQRRRRLACPSSDDPKAFAPLACSSALLTSFLRVRRRPHFSSSWCACLSVAQPAWKMLLREKATAWGKYGQSVSGEHQCGGCAHFSPQVMDTYYQLPRRQQPQSQKMQSHVGWASVEHNTERYHQTRSLSSDTIPHKQLSFSFGEIGIAAGPQGRRRKKGYTMEAKKSKEN